ncbi:MAG TPA: glycosyltransferase family 2 protein [Vicinamibacterales bacterium]|nr:glycosyltransferase family 2 protein [Vicinamibacterales bacterium]
MSILVPVYQEEATVGVLLARVAACDVASLGFEREILVCDDGSTDGTAARLRDAAEILPELRVFAHAANQGKGAAIRTLLTHATGDAVLIQDADLEYDVDDAVALLRCFRDGHDAVYGSRFLTRRRPIGMRPAHWLANRVLTTTANLLYGHRLTDEATCLKLVRTSLLRAMRLECRRFEFCPEVTAKLGRMGVAIEEVPVRYHARDAAGGKKVRWSDGVVAMAVLLRYRWS